MDSQPDKDFDRLSRLVASIIGAPIGLVTVFDAERQWFTSSVGVDQTEAPVSTSFCAHAIAEKSKPYLLVPDATLDPRFASAPLVVGPPHLRFYVGAPIVVKGQRVGTLCVLDTVPHHDLPQSVIDELVDLAGVASSLFALKDEARVRARTAAALTREEWRHALTLEAGRVGSWIWDLRSNQVEANDILRAMYGITGTGLFPVDKILGAIHPDDLGVVQTALDAAFEGGADFFCEMRVGHSGRWLVGRGRVYQRDAEGKPLIMMGINLDITETKQAADHTRQLLLELNHRVKNTLAMIQSLARQTLRQTSDPAQFIAAFSGRLRTLSETHILLSDRDWSGIGLNALLNKQLGPFLINSPAQLLLEGEDVELPPDQAIGLGLVFNELASNAVRHGALSLASGQVAISWTRPRPDRLDLVWTESGGPPVSPPTERGFGSVLIERSLDKLMTATVDLTFAPQGVQARISIPLAG